ncbi:MAG: DUF4349 domain-containing protein [Hyphomonas sp.]
MKTPLLLSVALLTLVACGSKDYASEGSYDASYAPEPAAVQDMAPAPKMEMDGQSNGANTAPTAQQYIAYAHSLGLRLPVDQIEPIMQGHVDACTTAGPTNCIVTNSWLNAYSEDNTSAMVQIRATPEWIETYLSGIDAQAEAAKGEVTNRQRTAEDLTSTIIDTGARLAAQQTLQQRLQDLLATRPGELGELLETERELARVNGEIDSLKSRMKALRQRVDMSVLTVNYETKRNPISQSALSPLGEAFGSFFYNLSGALAAVITAFAVGLPWLILIGVFLWVWLKIIWPRLKRKPKS